MIVRLLASQIPAFWESIKFCVVKADEVDESYRQVYLNDLLHSLLSDKAQCLVRLDDDKILIGLFIMESLHDKITEKENLHIRCLYSFVKVSDTEWRSDYEVLEKIASNFKCGAITFDTRNKRVAELGNLVGFRERYKSFILELGGE